MIVFDEDAPNGAEASQSVVSNTEAGIASITLNRPHRLNAFTAEMRERYLAALAAADRDPAVRAIVVTGAGRAFSAGADLAALDGLDAATLRQREAEQEFAFDMAMRLRTPLVAAVNGPAAGIGMAHALFADVRLASDTATFTTAFARLGLTAEGGIAWLLARQVGTGSALDLLYSSRTVDSAEALRIGLVQRVVPAADLGDVARAYAADLVAGTSAWSLAQMREQVYSSWSQTWDDAYATSRELVFESLDRPEFADRLARRRAPG
ncbi:enoyl-CoA hydratase-related protein [Pseudonocardia kunmingensis]|uniref:Enoyl-CoA hydratase n=1 Tax=Pseudonocardia kunmingensis TaxID=630975 RepID=A0A543DPU1_9PSEU|nr:enoyl-CoA hydratase-related protein [Pseudonocardia kunmingensis]TQM11325.1 enoyl-CoA hydratase [Pseudonocardia kunmingensis]